MRPIKQLLPLLLQVPFEFITAIALSISNLPGNPLVEGLFMNSWGLKDVLGNNADSSISVTFLLSLWKGKLDFDQQ